MKTFGVDEAADFLNVSTDTVRDLATAGAVPAAKIGKAWVFSDESLESYLRDEIARQTAARRGVKPGTPSTADEVQDGNYVLTAYARTVRKGRKARPIPKLY